MDDERIMLYWDSLVGDIDACILTDWPEHGYNHALSMTCNGFQDYEHDPRYTWPLQLAAILRRLRIVLE